MDRTLLTVLAYVTVALCWSGGWIAGKLGVTAVPPLELSFVRFAIAGVLLLGIARATRTPLPTERLGIVAIAAAFGILGYNALVFVGLTMAPASDAGLIVPTMAPVLTAVMATFIGERLTAFKVAGLALASIGAAMVIATGGEGATVSRDRLIGDLMVLAGAACWAGYATIGAIALRTASPLGVVTLSTLIGAAMLFPLGFLEHGYADVPSWELGPWLAILYLVVFATIIGFVLFYWAVQRFGASVGATTTYLVPVATLVLAYAILGERPQPLQLVGGLVILAGVRVATLRHTRRGSVEETAPS